VKSVGIDDLDLAAGDASIVFHDSPSSADLTPG
jgi:hypothetical protein